MAAQPPAETLSKSSSNQQARTSYEVAIQATLLTVRDRAQRYRTLVVAVAVVMVASIVFALVTWSWQPVLGVGLIVPFYGVFAVSDARIVLRWQRQILAFWAERRLDLKPLRAALGAVPRMPARTLDGMLAMLPMPAPADAGEPSTAELRRAAAFVACEAHVVQQVQSLLIAAARLVGVICVFAAVIAASVVPLVGLIAVPLLLAIGAARARMGLRRWREEIALAGEAGIDRAQLRADLNAVQWSTAAAPYVRQLSAAP